MKKISERVHDCYCRAKKLWFIMRLTFVVFLLGIMSLSASSSYSQETRLSLDLSSAGISEVLKSIENKSEFVFIYEDEILDLDKKVSLKVKGATIDRILIRSF